VMVEDDDVANSRERERDGDDGHGLWLPEEREEGGVSGSGLVSS